MGNALFPVFSSHNEWIFQHSVTSFSNWNFRNKIGEGNTTQFPLLNVNFVIFLSCSNKLHTQIPDVYNSYAHWTMKKRTFYFRHLDQIIRIKTLDRNMPKIQKIIVSSSFQNFTRNDKYTIFWEVKDWKYAYIKVVQEHKFCI
jgi:hypothetical protein